jgi:sugar-specific transcriptional regulator TrmB
MESIGSHKRDILVDRIEDTQEAQQDTQEQFKDALEQYRSIVQFDGGDLQSMYNKLNSEFEDSESAAQGITDHIDSVENVAEDLFAEWNEELKLYTSSSLRREMQSKLTSTKREYSQMLAAMRKAEKSTVPVLNSMRDQVLYLKHSLNARAIASIKGELAAIDSDVSRLIANMQKSIDESNRFIAKIKDQ